jgi:hypothetical protein
MNTQNDQKEIPVLQNMFEKWPSTIVPLVKMREFTGGALSPKRVKSLIAEGKGPEDGFYVGKRLCFPVKSLIAWLRTRYRPKRIEDWPKNIRDKRKNPSSQTKPGR